MKKEEIIKNVQKFCWEPWLERSFKTFMVSLFKDSITGQSFARIGVNAECDAWVQENGVWYKSEEVFDHLAKQIETILKNTSISSMTSSLENLYHQKKKRIKELSMEVKTNPLQQLKEIYEILTIVGAHIWFVHGADHYYSKKLQQEVSKYVKENIGVFIGDASFPIKKNKHTLFEEAMRNGTKPQQIADEYGWIKTRDGFSEPFTPEEIKKCMKNLEAMQHPKNVEVPLPLQPLFKEVQELVYYRTQRTDVFYELLFLARPILKRVAAYYNLSFQELKNYPIQTLLEEKPKKYDPFYAICYKGELLFSQTPLIKVINQKKDHAIHGVIAQKGIVRGVVRVVKNPSDLNKVKKGDILVTPMTFPSFIMAMQRAAAYITDEGGLTCHAAIIAREMKKPCIIGTKIATKVLKDGDFVEVDANKGIVRKLK